MLPIVVRQAAISHAAAAQNVLVQGGVNPYVAQALATRGVDQVDLAKGTYRLEPFTSLKGLHEMVKILVEAIERRVPMVVVADYDCDGATACTVAVTGLRAMGAQVDFVVPNRFTHGYGLTPDVVDLVRERFPKTRWIITVDNGIASIDGVKHANQHGMGVLVTDHHLPGKALPDAAAIVNPNQPGCPFPSKNLAGCGVMYYVLAATRTALASRGGLPSNVNLGEWLDIVALGTVADVVKLDANNRWLVRAGLANIRAGRARPGLRALFDVSKRNPYRASSQDFGFSVGPRINAAGRLDDMSIGIRCLTAGGDQEAFDLANDLFKLNEERKDIEKGMKEEAFTDIDLSGQEGCFTRVVFGESFHEGVIGIVAGRIKEEANTPVVVFAPVRDGDATMIKGSARSIPGLHLRDALDLVHKRGDNLLVKFGGHAMAAGLTLKRDNLDRFTSLFEEAVREMMGGQLQQKVITVDGELPTEALTVETAEALADQPWGQGFEVPLWTGQFEVLDARLVGQDQNHLKMTLGRDGETWSAMQFFTTEVPDQARVQVCYQLSVNEFRGERTADLIVSDRRDT